MLGATVWLLVAVVFLAGVLAGTIGLLALCWVMGGEPVEVRPSPGSGAQGPPHPGLW